MLLLRRFLTPHIKAYLLLKRVMMTTLWVLTGKINKTIASDSLLQINNCTLTQLLAFTPHGVKNAHKWEISYLMLVVKLMVTSCWDVCWLLMMETSWLSLKSKTLSPFYFGNKRHKILSFIGGKLRFTKLWSGLKKCLQTNFPILTIDILERGQQRG